MLKIFLRILPSILLIIGGFLFIVFKNSTWNNLIYLFFKDARKIKDKINEYTGKLWIIFGIVLILFTLLFNLNSSITVILYLLIIIISHLLTYFKFRDYIRR